MTAMISSYARDAWHTATDEGTTVLDASTGEPVARVSSTGLDVAGMVEHARRVGGPGAARADLPPAGGRPEAASPSICGSAATASTAVGLDRRHPRRRDDRHRRRRGRLLMIRQQGPARAAQRHRPPRRRPEALGRGGTFAGQHLCVPRRGAAVHINAFNFPCWGMLEKLAPALLAGVPRSSSPPARRPTSPRRSSVSSSSRTCCPRGRAADLRQRRRPVRPPHRPGHRRVHRLGPHCHTCERTRSVLANSVRFTAEADSLNCSVLGPTSAPGTARVRPLPRRGGQGDDREGGTEVHRHPPGTRPCSPRRRRARWPPRPAGGR